MLDRRRRAFALAAVAAALAAGVLIAVASVDGGPGVAERAYAAVTEPKLFHVVALSTVSAADPDQIERPAGVERTRMESWYDTAGAPAYHSIQHRLGEGRRPRLLGEFAGDRRGSRARIPGLAGPDVEGVAGASQPAERYDPTAAFKEAHRQGKVLDDGEATLAGRRVRRLAIEDPAQPEVGGVRVTGSRSTYWVDADTLYPVRYTTHAVFDSGKGRQRLSGRIDYTTFETLPRTPANLALLKLGARPK